MPAAVDSFFTLSDNLLCLILSKIPIREAVRCSVLSKRWRLLYTQIPQLTLSPYLLLGSHVNPNTDPLLIATVENIISKLLLLHSSDLEAFHLCNYNYKCNCKEGDYVENEWYFSLQSVWKWVRYASCRKVQHLTLCISSEMEDAPPELFCCTRLTTLTLFNCILIHVPTHFSGFNHLISCFFRKIEFTDESLSCFSDSPFLEKLVIWDSVGLQKPIISAPNLTQLAICDSEVVEVLTVNCPKLKTLETCMIQDLRVNGVLFQEISYAVEYLTMERGRNVTVIQLEWDDAIYSISEERCNFSPERYLEIVSTFKALKELSIPTWSLFATVKEIIDLIHKLLDTLPNLESLDMPDTFVLEIVRDPIASCRSSPLANIRMIKVEIEEYDQREIAVLSSFLEGCSALERMELKVSGYITRDAIASFIELFYVRRASTRARVNIDLRG